MITSELIHELDLDLDAFEFDPAALSVPEKSRRTLRGVSFLSDTGESTSGFNYTLSMFKENEQGQRCFDVGYLKQHQIRSPRAHRTPTELYHLVKHNFDKIAALGIELFRARLSVIGPGQSIPRHLDSTSEGDYCLKLHIPLRTNPDAWFMFDEHQFHLRENRAYIVNVAPAHWFENRGTVARYHILADCIVTNKNLPFYCEHYNQLIEYYDDWDRLVLSDSDQTEFIQRLVP